MNLEEQYSKTGGFSNLIFSLSIIKLVWHYQRIKKKELCLSCIERFCDLTKHVYNVLI